MPTTKRYKTSLEVVEQAAEEGMKLLFAQLVLADDFALFAGRKREGWMEGQLKAALNEFRHQKRPSALLAYLKPAGPPKEVAHD